MLLKKFMWFSRSAIMKGLQASKDYGDERFLGPTLLEKQL
jgi:hypothetical protein